MAHAETLHLLVAAELAYALTDFYNLRLVLLLFLRSWVQDENTGSYHDYFCERGFD